MAHLLRHAIFRDAEIICGKSAHRIALFVEYEKIRSDESIRRSYLGY